MATNLDPIISRDAPLPHGPIGQVLERVSGALALAGGLVMLGLMLLSSVSVLGRSLPQLLGFLGLALTPRSIPGDIEIVQLGCAVAIFAFLPYCQIRRANVFVAFFTQGLPIRHRSKFDLFANGLYLLLALIIAKQLTLGTLEKFANRDTTMVLRLPEGWAYLLALASAWLLVAVTAYTVARSAREIFTGRAIGPQASGEH